MNINSRSFQSKSNKIVKLVKSVLFYSDSYIIWHIHFVDVTTGEVKSIQQIFFHLCRRRVSRDRMKKIADFFYIMTALQALLKML